MISGSAGIPGLQQHHGFDESLPPSSLIDDGAPYIDGEEGQIGRGGMGQDLAEADQHRRHKPI